MAGQDNRMSMRAPLWAAAILLALALGVCGLGTQVASAAENEVDAPATDAVLVAQQEASAELEDVVASGVSNEEATGDTAPEPVADGAAGDTAIEPDVETGAETGAESNSNSAGVSVENAAEELDGASTSASSAMPACEESPTTNEVAPDEPSSVEPEATAPAASAPAAVLATAAVTAASAPSPSAAKQAVVNPKPAATQKTAAKTTKAKTVAKKVAKKADAFTFKTGWYTFKAALNKAFALTVIGSKSKAGTKLRLQKVSNVTGQAFRVLKAGQYYRIYPGTGFSMRLVMTGSTVALGKSKGKDSLFRLVKNANGTYQFVNVATGNALALTKGVAKNKAAVSGSAYQDGAGAQSFSLVARKGILKQGIYTFRTVLSGKRAIGPKTGKTESGAKMALSAYSAALYQKWQVKAVPGKQNIYTLESLATGYKLTAVKGKAATQKADSGASNQWWQVVGAHGKVILKNVKTGQVLQTSKSKAGEGVAVVCTAKSAKRLDSQRWSFTKVTPVSTGFYELDAATSRSLALEIMGGSSQNGAKARLATASGDNNQLWYYDATAKTLTCVASGKLLDINGASTASGASVIQWNPHGGANQQWTFSYVGGGNFKVASKLGNALTLTVPSAAAGSTATSSTYTGAGTQQWHLVQASETATSNIALSFTLDQMARWQKTGNPYYAGYTLAYLKSVLNPANGSKYKFVDLRKGTGVTAAQLNSYIATVGSKGKLAGLGSAIVAACKTHGLNEVYLLAHAILESDWGRSELASGYKYKGGTIDGTYYKKGTYYNFFGIGAYDDSPLSGGRKAAIINGWSSPEKAITGAAQWISSNYVYRATYAQPTLYAMKWDYAYSQANNARGWHQYATSLTWADSIGRLMGECYSKAGANPRLSYQMPVYR